MWSLLPSDEMALNSAELKESFHINHGLPSWLVTQEYRPLIWKQLKNAGQHKRQSSSASGWIICPYASELRNAMVDDGFIRGHSALQLTAHDEFEESGITVALEDKQSFPNRVWLYDKKLCTKRGSQFGDFYALAVDLSVAMPAVNAEGVVNWQSTTQVYGDFKRIQSDLKKGEPGGYSALRTRRVVEGKMQGEVTVVDAEQASKVEVSEKRLAAADRFERENGIRRRCASAYGKSP